MDEKTVFHFYLWHCMLSWDETVSGNELGGDMNVFSGREKYDLPPETNTSFPKFDGTQRWGWNWNSHWKEIWKPVETNTIQQFPKFDGVSLPTSSVFGRFPTLCEEKTPRNPSNSQFICMGELINRFLHVWCPISHSVWPLHFPHHLTGGCGTRLSIRRQDQNNYSDTETRCLV